MFCGAFCFSAHQQPITRPNVARVAALPTAHAWQELAMNSHHAEVSRYCHVARNEPRLAEAVLVDASNIPAPDR